MMLMTMVQALNRALDEEMAQDPRVVLLGEDVGKRGGVFLVTEGLQAKYGED
ncbi:MAG: alpha-ketoacid dehydrogenase subunit beta, partial [Thermus sp.]